MSQQTALLLEPISGCPQPSVCPLSQAKAGRTVRIKELRGAADMKNRLREMGLCEDRQVRLVRRESNVICQVCNARLGLSQRLADSILVEEIQPIVA